jgi:hypothetical protein
MHLVLRIRAGVVAVTKAISTAISRHPILSARIETRDGRPFFIRDGEVSVELEEAPCNDQDLSRSVSSYVWRRFDFGLDPVSRSKIFRINSEESILAVVVHNMALDALSRNILLGDIVDALRFPHRATYDVPSGQLLYEDYLVCMDEWLRSPDSDRGVSFWRERLNGVRPLTLAQEASTESDNEVGGSRPFMMGEGLCQKALLLARECRVTNFAVFLAAQALAVSLRTGEKDITLLTIISGREDSRFFNTIGHFADRIFYRIRLTDGINFRQLIQLAWKSIVESNEHGYIVFDDILDRVLGDGQFISTPSINYMEDDLSIDLENARKDSLWEKYPISASTSHTRPWAGMFGYQLKMRRVNLNISGVIRYSKGFGPNNSYFLSDFIYVLHQVLENPNLNIDSILPSPNFDAVLFREGKGGGRAS